MIRVGVVGCGTIGSYLIKNIIKKCKKNITLSGISDPDIEKVKKLKRSLKKGLKSFALEELVKKSDLVIEAANAEAAAEVLRLALKFKKDVMVMSVGGLLLNKQLIKAVYKSKNRVYVPSGAIAGIDALKTARMGRIQSVKLTTKKPVAGLVGAPYLKERGIDLRKVKKDTVIFQGSAADAVASFPKNINVAAILSLAGIGPLKTEVCIIASPLVKRNTHTIAIEGDFGTIVCITENVPSRLNPKTSMLAVLSALATLDGILNNLKIGT